MSLKRGEQQPRIPLSKLTGVNLIAPHATFYDTAVTAALMLTFEDPSAASGKSDVQSKQKATENLLNQFPEQPFKKDFVDGLKIRGRQQPVREYVTDLRGRLKEIGGGLGDGLLEEHEKEDDNYLVGLLLGTPVGDAEAEQQDKARGNQKAATQVSDGSGKLGKLAAMHLKQQETQDSQKSVVRDPTEQFLQRMRDATKQAYEIITKEDHHKNRFQSEPHASKDKPSTADDSANQEADDKPVLRQKIHKLREVVDGIIKSKVEAKNALAVKQGRKIVDKETEIYDRMVLLPDINKDLAKNNTNEEHHKETMLFKASAVKLSSFIAKRISDRQDETERIKKLYKEQFGEGGATIKDAQSKSSLKDSNQIMFMDASTLLLDGSKNSIFITSTDEEEQRTQLNESRTRNKLAVRSLALPMSIRHSPLREAIYLTNQSVRRYKFPSAYTKIGIADGGSQSIDNTTSIFASKDRIDKLKEMISLPSLTKRKQGDQSLGMDTLNMSNLGDSGQNGSLNRLSQIKEMMESTTSLLTNPNLIQQMGSTGNTLSFKVDEEDQVQILGTDSPRLLGSEIYRQQRGARMASKKSGSLDFSSLSITQQNSGSGLGRQQYNNKLSLIPTSGLASKLQGQNSMNQQSIMKVQQSFSPQSQMNSFDSQITTEDQSYSKTQRLSKFVSKQLADTKDFRQFLNQSIDQIKQDMIQNSQSNIRQALNRKLMAKVQSIVSQEDYANLVDESGPGRSLFSVAGASSQTGNLSSANTGLSPKRFGKQNSITYRKPNQPMRKVSRYSDTVADMMRNTGISPVPEESPIALRQQSTTKQ